MDRSFGMVRRSIDGGQLQRAIPGITNIVPGSCRHKNAISGFQATLEIQGFFPIPHTNKRLPVFDPDELIGIRVHLYTYFPAGGNVH